MVTVRMLANECGYVRGQVVSIVDTLANMLVKRGSAERVEVVDGKVIKSKTVRNKAVKAGE